MLFMIFFRYLGFRNTPHRAIQALSSLIEVFVVILDTGHRALQEYSCLLRKVTDLFCIRKMTGSEQRFLFST